MIQQTIYVPRKLGEGDLIVYKRDKLSLHPKQFVEKQENKIVLDLEELKKIILGAQVAAFAWGIELCSFESCKEQSETYFSHLIKNL